MTVFFKKRAKKIKAAPLPGRHMSFLRTLYRADRAEGSIPSKLWRDLEIDLKSRKKVARKWLRRVFVSPQKCLRTDGRIYNRMRTGKMIESDGKTELVKCDAGGNFVLADSPNSILTVVVEDNTLPFLTVDSRHNLKLSAYFPPPELLIRSNFTCFWLSHIFRKHSLWSNLPHEVKEIIWGFVD